MIAKRTERGNGARHVGLSLESPSFRRRTRCLGALTLAARVHIHEGHALQEGKEGLEEQERLEEKLMK